MSPKTIRAFEDQLLQAIEEETGRWRGEFEALGYVLPPLSLRRRGRDQRSPEYLSEVEMVLLQDARRGARAGCFARTYRLWEDGRSFWPDHRLLKIAVKTDLDSWLKSLSSPLAGPTA